MQQQLQCNQKQLLEVMKFKENHEKRLSNTEKKIQDLEIKLKKEEEANLRSEIDRSEHIIRLQNVEEIKKDNKEDLFSLITEAVADFMEMDPSEVSNELDRVYRMGNALTKRNSLPREVHIRCVRKAFRDEILLQARNKNMMIRQKEVRVLKDTPWRIRVKRRSYRALVECLRQNNIEYRWLIPEGIIFNYRGDRQKINSVFKAKEFLERNGRELGYEDSETESEEDEEDKEEGEVKTPESEEQDKEQVTDLEKKKKKKKSKQVEPADRNLRSKLKH